MKIGLEKEFFLINGNGEITVIGDKSNIPYDGCRLLGEARGLPADTATLAVHNLMAEIHKISKICTQEGVIIDDSPIKKVPRDVSLAARRISTKGPLKFENLYGFKDHRHSRGEVTSGIHISFTCELNFSYLHWTKDTKDYPLMKEFKYNSIWDYPQLFRHLDMKFKDEIKESKRNQGFYEIKDDGRIEYRSLPSNVNLLKVCDVLEDYFQNNK